MRDALGWAVAEFWVQHTDGYRIVHERHANLEVLDRFERESASIVVPTAWVRADRWELDRAVTSATARNVFWSADTTLSRVSLRRGMIQEAGLQTQVALIVPNRGYMQQLVMLFDTRRRDASVEEMNGLAIATFMLGWAGEWEPEAVAEPVPYEPVTHLDARVRCLVGPKGSVRLTVSEWDLLTCLFNSLGKAVSFRDLTDEVWRAPEELVGRDVVYEVVARLRRQLAAVGNDYQLVSVPRYGYVLEPAPPGS
jgi:hypothetical protein